MEIINPRETKGEDLLITKDEHFSIQYNGSRPVSYTLHGVEVSFEEEASNNYQKYWRHRNSSYGNSGATGIKNGMISEAYAIKLLMKELGEGGYEIMPYGLLEQRHVSIYKNQKFELKGSSNWAADIVYRNKATNKLNYLEVKSGKTNYSGGPVHQVTKYHYGKYRAANKKLIWFDVESSGTVAYWALFEMSDEMKNHSCVNRHGAPCYDLQKVKPLHKGKRYEELMVDHIGQVLDNLYK